MIRRLLWPFLFTGLGLGLAFVIHETTNNPFLYLRGELSAVVLLVVVLITLVVESAVLWGYYKEQEEKERLAQYRSEAAEDKRRFLHRLDHELKNPITAMRAGLANVSGAALAPEQDKALASVEAQAVRLGRLTADLRKIAELEMRTLERVPVDLAQVLGEVMEFAEEHPDYEERRVSLSVPQAPWPLPTIYGDRDLLFLAVYNLVENAIKFTGVDEAIELRAREDGGFVIVEVADTGPGITAEEQAHVWEELYRGANGRGVPGSGLGLSLVKAIVERHGGRVELDSRMGQGTLVSVYLPVLKDG